MPYFRIREAATLLGVSYDTVRRWVDSGELAAVKGSEGPIRIEGAALARHSKKLAAAVEDPSSVGRSARNRFVGLVTEIIADTVMAQVEIQAGPHRVVSLMTAEAVHELGLEVGSVAVAVVKATMVIVETPGEK